MLLPLPALASFELGKTRIFFNTDAASATAAIRNTGTTSARYELSVTPRNEISAASQAGLVAFPPTFELKPGEQQLVRFIFRQRAKAVAPLFYFIDVIEQTAQTRPGQGLNVTFGFPLYYVDPAEKPAVKYDLVREAGKDRVIGVRLENTSKTVVILSGLKLGGSRMLSMDAVLMPGEAKAFNPQGWQPPYQFEIRNYGLMDIK
ncbi:MAG: fimbria/pilus periplasmic chaperone [Pseudomonadota bacterium]